MPINDGIINKFAAGDDIEIDRTVTGIKSTGQTLVKAWFTVKAKATDSDSLIVFEKAITVAENVGTGRITDDGSTGNDPALRFDITSTDTALLTPKTAYYYFVRVKTSAGKLYTPEEGTMVAWERGSASV